MKTAFISDIHSNYEALKEVMKKIDKESPDQTLCGGDIVGYAANPIECIDLILERNIKSIIGNHDSAVLKDKCIKKFNEYAISATIWTNDILSKDHLKYLDSLSLMIHEKNFILTHASYHEPRKWHYIFESIEASMTLNLLEKKICFVGHTHVPGIFYVGGRVEAISEGDVNIKDVEKCVINVGSVGQPRDKDNRACYVIYDDEKDIVSFKRVAYDIKKTQEDILKAGLPDFLAERLADGH